MGTVSKFKYDFGLDIFVMRDFWATEAALTVAMLAYNLMSVSRQAVIRKRHIRRYQPFNKRYKG